MDLIFAGLTAWVVALALAIAMLCAWGIGTLMGRRLVGKRAQVKPSKFDDAVMGLLGLLLAFTFAVSIGKHDQRRMAVVADSNAIGDFYTCATLLKEPVRGKLRAVIRQYAELRLSLARRQINIAELEKALPGMQQMQAQMTELVAQALRDGTPIAVSLTNTLNELISNHAKRLALIKDRLPASVVILLFASAIIAAFLIGREQGIAGASEFTGTLLFIVLVSLAIYVTLDLNQPERGLVRVSQEPIEALISSMSD